MAKGLLHGTLKATIYEVDNTHGDGGGGKSWWKTELYATMDLDKWEVGRTRSQEPENPKWNESFHVYCAHHVSSVIISVKKVTVFGSTVIGRAKIPVDDLLEGEEVDGVEILDEKKKAVKAGSKIHVKLKYLHVTEDPNCNWGRGIKSSEYGGVPHTFFPQRQGCRVSLYQDAHVPDDFDPKILLSNGSYYNPHRCWKDMLDAITNAEHFIYITGWSVYPEISLIRDSEGGNNTLGELLKKKADEGVKVLMLVWKDWTSSDLLRYKGYMATHDKETRKYFKGSKVKCKLCTRSLRDGGISAENILNVTRFTHHQKSLVVDSKLPNGDLETRHVMSFVGGLDLCNGRYDTPVHSLFRTLDTDHKDDFHQPNFPDSNITKGGPREPWHDIHSRLEGEIAWDVLSNFEERWKKQGGKDTLFFIRKLDHFIRSPYQVMSPDDKESWNVQLFRSIDSGATFGDPPKEAAKSGLVSGEHGIIERSIQDAYIHAIRRAKNFIYIESQYFLGSAFGWDSDNIKDKHLGALHLIPKELSLKIVSKINAEEKFTVYVVIPMWPEGEPERKPVPSILDMQRRTMEMMYKDIIRALQLKRVKKYDLRDYLVSRNSDWVIFDQVFRK